MLRQMCILDKLEQLGALNQVKAVASEEKDCTNEIIKNALKDKSVDSIGNMTSLIIKTDKR